MELLESSQNPFITQIRMPECCLLFTSREEVFNTMTVERYLRLIAGSFVLATILLGYFHSPYWFLFTGFVALNLIQSAFTNWCPMMTFLRWLGVSDEPLKAQLQSR